MSHIPDLAQVTQTAQSADTARSTIKKYGKGYYKATFLFPRALREDVWTLYQFVRLPDEIVDNKAEGVAGDMKADADLAQWENEWKCVLEIGHSEHNVVIDDFIKIVRKYNIPTQYISDYFTAMRQDLTKRTYATYAEIEQYMHGSATVIGYMMSYIIGFAKDNTVDIVHVLEHARALAEAFQMTNFLRDIADDYKDRGRIYIPQEDMTRFGVSESHIAGGIVGKGADDAWKKLMQYEIERTRALYAKGVAGIVYLDPRGRKAVYAAALIYKEILDMIERNSYDVFSKRAVVSPLRKTMLVCRAYVTKISNRDWGRNRRTSAR